MSVGLCPSQSLGRTHIVIIRYTLAI